MAVTKYLDKTGLTYFWSKIKTYITNMLTWSNISGKPSSFTPASHTHNKLVSAGDNVASTLTNTYAAGHFNVRWFSQTDKVPGQPSQYGFLATFATGDNASEVHQLWCTQNNGDLYHRGTNESSYTAPPVFKKIIDSSNETQLSLTTSGSGNAITALSVSNHAITATKGTTFLTSHQSLANYVTLNTTQTISGIKTFSGNTYINPSDNTGFKVKYGDDQEVSLQIGGSHINRGLYDKKLDKWIVYANNTECIFNGRADCLNSTTPSIGGRLYYTTGQPVIGTTSGNAYRGSSSDFSLLSFPDGGTAAGTVANIQNLRLAWSSSTTFWTDLFFSPNNHYIWHRDVMSGTAFGWRRIVEENVSGIDNQTWNISINGNAATATKATQDSDGNDIDTTYLKLSGGIMTGDLHFSNGAWINGPQCIELMPSATTSNHGGFIDFHYNRNTVDYTSRIIESASGTLSVNGVTITTGKVVTATTFTGALNGNATTATTATKANGLAGSSTPLGNGLIYTTGGLALGSSAGQLYKGSSNNAALISAPENGTYYSSTSGNVQNLRLAWSSDGKYLTDIFASPNDNFLWHRNVSNTVAKPWRRLVEENASGITAPNWDISISGNAATATSSSGNFNVNGQLTATGQVWLSEELRLKMDAYAINTQLSTDDYSSMVFEDKNQYFLGGVWHGMMSGATKESRCSIRAFKVEAATDTNRYNRNYATIGVAKFADDSGYGFVYGISSFRPSEANVTLGSNSINTRWGQIYSASTTISTSDERLKTSIQQISSDVLDAWDNVNWLQFQMKESVQSKGDLARIHSGIIAQQVKKVFENAGLDACKYGFFCYDEWDAIPDKLDKNGNIEEHGEKAGNQYSIRYIEALCLEAAYQRRKNKILENRISELENQLSSVLQTLKELKGVG